MKPYTIVEVEQDITAALAAGSAEEVERLAQVLDGMHEPVRQVTVLAAALWYAEQGLHVFPLQAGSKIPHKGTRGCKDGTTDPDAIRAWWERWPDSNLAIATGHVVDVIDIDGPEGVKSWLSIIDELPPIFGRVSTPRPGGNHLYVAATPGRGNKAGLLPHIDYRGDGGYVVAPPSFTDQGTYRWLQPLDMAALMAGVAA